MPSGPGIKRRRRWPYLLLVAAIALGALSWSVSSMMRMPGATHTGLLPPLTDQQIALRDALEAHVQRLAGDIGERNLWRHDALRDAAQYIESQLQGAGYTVRRQTYQLQGRDCDNIEVEITGSTRPDQIVILGAHYDSVQHSPGANDNATAVAALIELSRAFRDANPGRTLRFVAFVNEEPPFFHTDAMGSMVYASRSRERGEDIVAMIALDGLGYYSDEPGTQKYPFPFNVLYPSTADFIGFVSNPGSAKLLRRAIGTFRQHAAFPSQGAAIPGFVPGAGWSDHWSFWRHGYPGIMVTDTLPFRYPHYHMPTDTPDQIDHDRLARVIDGLRHVLADLADADI